tara:strand:+ start:693 stop:926 length:234 start_codon:yes stop_codon:yes gene_type:complete
MCFVGRDKFNLTKKKEEEQMSLSIEVCTPADRPILMELADISWLNSDDAEIMKLFYTNKYGYFFDGKAEHFNIVCSV